MNLGKTPMAIEASATRPVNVLVYDGDTVYYKTTTPVSTSDTSIAKGSAVEFTKNVWIISGGSSYLIVKELTRPTYDQVTLDAATIGSATITTATVSALTGLADATFTDSTANAAHNKSIFYDGTTLVFRISASTVTADLY